MRQVDGGKETCGKGKDGLFIRVHQKSLLKAKNKLRELTKRNRGRNVRQVMKEVKLYMTGWLNDYAIASMKQRMQRWDEWLRHRIRAYIWKQWKKPRTKLRNLMKLGVPEYFARMAAYSRRGYWFMTEHDFTTDAATAATNLETTIAAAFPTTLLAAYGAASVQGIADAMTGYSMSSTGSGIASNVQSAVSTNLTGTTLRSVGVNAMTGLKAGINAGRSGVISAMRSAAQAAVSAAKTALKIKSPSQVFRDEVGVMTMKGFGEGVLTESKAQAKIIRNAARFLTDEAREGLENGVAQLTLL